MQPSRPAPPIQIYLLFAVAIVGAIVPFATSLASLYDIWNLKPEYSHGLIIPLLSAFLIWRQRSELRHLPFTGSWAGVLLIAVGFVLRYIGTLTTMQTLEHYAFLLVIYGLVLALTGPLIVRRLWVPLLILVFAIPLPNIFSNPLSLQLQLLSSALGVGVIRAAGISVLLEGNVIDLGTYQLEVAEACSGLRYLFPLMTLAFIMAYLFRGPVWKRVLLILATIPITVLMNSLRIGFIGITVERWGSGMAEGMLHDFEGWLVFMFSTAALLATGAALARIGRPGLSWRDAFDFDLTSARRASPASPSGPVIVSRKFMPTSFLAAAALVLLGAFTGLAVPAPRVFSPPRATFDEFPDTIGEWLGRRDQLQPMFLDILRLDDYVLSDYRDSRGDVVNFYSAYYQVQDSTRGVHSPRDCMPGGGWEIQKLERRQFPAGSGVAAFPMNRAIIQLGSSRRVVYYWFQERGRHLTNDYVVRWYLLWDAITLHRTDGALVRFVTELPRGASEAAADARIMNLATQVVPTLGRYIPN